MDKQRDKWMDRQTNGWTAGQMDGQTDKWMDDANPRVALQLIIKQVSNKNPALLMIAHVSKSVLFVGFVCF